MILIQNLNWWLYSYDEREGHGKNKKRFVQYLCAFAEAKCFRPLIYALRIEIRKNRKGWQRHQTVPTPPCPSSPMPPLDALECPPNRDRHFGRQCPLGTDRCSPGDDARSVHHGCPRVVAHGPLTTVSKWHSTWLTRCMTKLCIQQSQESPHPLEPTPSYTTSINLPSPLSTWCRPLRTVNSFPICIDYYRPRFNWPPPTPCNISLPPPQWAPASTIIISSPRFAR